MYLYFHRQKHQNSYHRLLNVFEEHEGFPIRIGYLFLEFYGCKKRFWFSFLPWDFSIIFHCTGSDSIRLPIKQDSFRNLPFTTSGSFLVCFRHFCSFIDDPLVTVQICVLTLLQWILLYIWLLVFVVEKIFLSYFFAFLYSSNWKARRHF